MNKFFASLLALAVVVMVGCGSVAPYAATVNKERLTQGDLEGELDAITKNGDYVKLLEQGQPPVKVRGTGKGTFDPTFVARVLTREIFYRLVSDELARRNLKVDASALAAARQSVVQQVGGDTVLAKFPAGYRSSLERRTAELDTLTQALAKVNPVKAPDPRTFYEENKATYDTYACVSHILVKDKATADDLAARIGRGEDFATLARTQSIDNQGPGGGSAAKGGDLGCSDPAGYVPEFAAAVKAQAVGQVSAPVQTQFGFHVIKVTSRKVASYDDAKQQAQQAAGQGGSQKLQEWVTTALKKAKVKMNPKFGRFNKDKPVPQVEAPQAPATATPTTSPLAPAPQTPGG